MKLTVTRSELALAIVYEQDHHNNQNDQDENSGIFLSSISSIHRTYQSSGGVSDTGIFRSLL